MQNKWNGKWAKRLTYRDEADKRRENDIELNGEEKRFYSEKWAIEKTDDAGKNEKWPQKLECQMPIKTSIQDSF